MHRSRSTISPTKEGSLTTESVMMSVVRDPLRLFFGLELEDELRAELAAALEQVRQLCPRARVSRAEKLHITLAFLGARPAAQVPALVDLMRERASTTPRFALSVRGAGTFGSRGARVLWAGVRGELEVATRLAGQLAQAGGVTPSRPWSPHITLARARGRADRTLPAAAEALGEREFGPLNAREVVLFESRPAERGVEYVALDRAPLSTTRSSPASPGLS
jgi:2'-5' RNA ligase